VVIYTHMGEITLDGSSLIFHEVLKSTFSRAGFSVDQASGRRLIGVVEILGLFNKINKLREQDKTSQAANNAPSRMPLTFIANTSEYRRCTDRDCWLDGKMVDWVSAQPDGSMAMVTRQQIYSLTFDGLPFAKSVISKDQWPDQTMVVLQNLSHKLMMQTYGGISYHCSLQNDTSLGTSLMRRRLRAASSETPFQFVGLSTVDGVTCRKFHMFNASADTEMYEHYEEKRVYQLRWLNMKVTFDTLSAVEGEQTNPLTRADFDLERAMRNCDPHDRLAPPRLVEGELTNKITPAPTWGFQKSQDNISDLYNTSGGAYLDNLFPAGNYSSYNASNWSLGGDDRRRAFDKAVSESWDGTVVQMSKREFESHRERHLRDLSFVDCQPDSPTATLAFPPFTVVPGFVEKGSFFNAEFYDIRECGGSRIVAVYIVLSASQRRFAQLSDCLSREGQLELYLPLAGNPRPVAMLGELNYKLSLHNCLAGTVGEVFASFLSKIVNMEAGLRIGGKGDVLNRQQCQQCGGVVTSSGGKDCWLKRADAFYKIPDQPVSSRNSYVANSWPWKFYAETDFPFWDIAFYWTSADICRDKCTERIDCAGYTVSRDAFWGSNACWLKSTAAFDPGNQVYNWDRFSVVKSWVSGKGRTPEFRASTDFPGNDVGSFASDSAGCLKRCMDMQECGGLIMNSAAYEQRPGGFCWLKQFNAFMRDNARYDNDRHAIIKNGFFQTAPKVEFNTEYPGGVIREIRAEKIECMSECSSTPGCYGVSMNQRAYDGFRDGICWIKFKYVFYPGNRRSRTDRIAITLEPFVKISETDYTGDDVVPDIRYYRVNNPEECLGRCLTHNADLLRQQGGYPVIPQFWGEGYAAAHFLTTRAEARLTLDLAFGAKCAQNQQAGSPARMGLSLSLFYSVETDLVFISWRTSDRINIFPRGGNLCGGDNSLFLSTNGNPAKWYKFYDIPNQKCK
jgi:hypothetical protein